MSCETCPQMVTETIASNVRDVLWRVRRVQRLGTMYSRFIEELGASYLDVVQRRLDELFAVIPPPPVIDVQFLQDLLTCPLTPIALGLEPAQMLSEDPRGVLRAFQSMCGDYRRRLEIMYDMTLADVDASDPRPLAAILHSDLEAAATSDDLIEFFARKDQRGNIQYDATGTPVPRQSILDQQQSSAFFDRGSVNPYTRQFIDGSYTPAGPNRVINAGGANGITVAGLISPRGRIEERTASTNIPIRVVRKYVHELVGAVEDPIYFATRFALVAAAVESVKNTCSETYNSPQWPFILWEDHVRGFSFDSTTGIPSGLPAQAQGIVSTFMRIELKLAGWSSLSSAPV